MFSIEKWQEIFSIISKNKLRTFLTAFSVSWGIFILIVLLGAGQGLRNGAENQFMGDAINSISIRGGVTGEAYKGFEPGRTIQLTNDDIDLIRSQVEGIDKVSALFDNFSVTTISYKNEHGSFQMRSCKPDIEFLENIKVTAGRFINETDESEARKVCVLGQPVKDILFKEEDAIGKYIDVDGILFKVAGVFYDKGRNDMNRIYIPLRVAQKVFNGQKNVNNIWMSTGDVGLERSNKMLEEIRSLMASKYSFKESDLRALNAWNNTDEYTRIMNLLNGIKIFIWIIGSMTLLAGVVGISNIMMISVKERTKEIGVRKALGATPASIIGLIIQEAVLITGIAGASGLILGVGLLQLLSKAITDVEYLKNPEVNLSVALYSILLLIISGAVAGFIPAYKASKVEPIVALRED